jgi:hypothetical protein
MALFSLLSATGPVPSWGQEESRSLREAFFRALSEYFEVEVEEVGILAEWSLAPDEVPVALFLADRAGVSPDACIGLRRGGRPWREVARRVGLGARAFYLDLPEDQDLGMLARAYGEYRTLPPEGWPNIHLEDQEIIALVNLRVLSEGTGSPPLRVLRLSEEAGSFMAAYSLLLGG